MAYIKEELTGHRAVAVASTKRETTVLLVETLNKSRGTCSKSLSLYLPTNNSTSQSLHTMLMETLALEHLSVS